MYVYMYKFFINAIMLYVFYLTINHNGLVICVFVNKFSSSHMKL